MLLSDKHSPLSSGPSIPRVAAEIQGKRKEKRPEGTHKQKINARNIIR